MYLRKPFLIFAFTLPSCSIPFNSQKQSEHLVIETRELYSVVDVDGNQASAPTSSSSPVVEAVIQTFRSKYSTTTFTANEPARSRASAQGLTEIVPAITARSETILSDSISARTSTAPVSTKTKSPLANPSYFIVNPQGTTASLNIDIATMTTTIKNDLRPYNTASALLPNAVVRILSSASPTATAKPFSTSLHTPPSELPSNTSSKPLQPSTTIVNSVYEPMGNPITSHDGIWNTTYRFPNITTTTSARWNTAARVTLSL